MKLHTLGRYHLNKDGSINYERTSKSLGMTQSDLYFLHKGRFDYIDAPTLMAGVFVGYHPTSTSPIFFAPWMMETCFHSNKDLRRIREIITRENTPHWSTYDYFIMDCNGKILYKNFDMQSTIDENGVIHLTSSDYSLNDMVYPATRKKYPYKYFYCYGRTFDSLNKHIKDVADAKIIKLPKHFKKGFSKTPCHPFDTQQSFER